MCSVQLLIKSQRVCRTCLYWPNGHFAHTKYCKSYGTFHPWQSIISKRKLLQRWKRLIVNCQPDHCWTVQLFNINVSKQYVWLWKMYFSVTKKIIWTLVINTVDYLDSPDTLMNSSALSLPALYSQLQQSTSTSSPQKPNVTRPIDPYQSNYIRMERKFKTAMRKVKMHRTILKKQNQN